MTLLTRARRFRTLPLLAVAAICVILGIAYYYAGVRMPLAGNAAPETALTEWSYAVKNVPALDAGKIVGVSDLSAHTEVRRGTYALYGGQVVWLEWNLPGDDATSTAYRVPGAEPETFKIFENSYEVQPYGKDARNVYYRARILSGADPETFGILDPGGIAADASHVWIGGALLADLDPKTVREDEWFIVDARHVYYSTMELPDIDAATFAAIGTIGPRYYGTDKDSAYYVQDVDQFIPGYDSLRSGRFEDPEGASIDVSSFRGCTKDEAVEARELHAVQHPESPVPQWRDEYECLTAMVREGGEAFRRYYDSVDGDVFADVR